MKKACKFFSLIAACAVALSGVVTANADEALQTGSIKIGLFEAEDDTPQEGAEVTIYQVADFSVENYQYSYSYTQAFDGCTVDLSLITDDAAEEFSEFVTENDISGETKAVDGEGYVYFEEVPLGLYLAVQTKEVPGNTTINPFLITVPQGSTDDLVYDVEAVPKTDIVRLVEISVKKVWNDEEKSRPSSVTIKLLNNGEVIDEVVLSEDNGWEHTWADMPKGDGYSVEEKVPKGYYANYKQNGFDFTVTNTDRLIQTGQLNWPIPVLAGAGLVLLIIGFVIYQKASSKNEK